MSTTPLHEKAFPTDETTKLPRPFILRRLHSLMGAWLILYLFEHLLANSQAALFFADDGYGFVIIVNQIHQLPYLKVIELVFLGIPFFVHGWWGIVYLRTAKFNSYKTDGTKPSLPQYPRNRAYTWQRITSWILLFGILGHVIQMRFVDYPTLIHHGDQKKYIVRLNADKGLYGVAHKLGVRLLDEKQIAKEQASLKADEEKFGKLEKSPDYYVLKDDIEEKKEWVHALEKRSLKPGQVLAQTNDAGTAFLLVVRDTFKSPLMVVLYSILVIAAAYHAFNGLWTFLITWGVTLTRRSQKRMLALAHGLTILVTLMGLMAAWGTYGIVLWQMRG